MIAPSGGGPAARAVFHRLLAAQSLALVSTGVATVALALLAYDIAGAEAGAALGTALAVKMLASVIVAPIAAALLEGLPRRATLVVLDLIRAAIVLTLPFVSSLLSIYLLIFLFQAASAAFTTLLQATVPVLLADQREYARALSLTRLAVELENLISPLVAALLLLALNFRGLFVLTVLGFLVSAGLVLTVALPALRTVTSGEVGARILRGFRIFARIPRLRALIALNLAAALAGAMVLVNTVVFVQATLGLTGAATAAALAVYGAGSILGALLVPRMMTLISDRSVTLAGAALASVGLLLGLSVSSYEALLPLWLLLGFATALAQTPAGILICRSSGDDDRQSLYAAQFAISSACLLVGYLLAGWLGTESGMAAAFLLLGLLAGGAALAAAWVWPRSDAAPLASVPPEARSGPAAF